MAHTSIQSSSKPTVSPPCAVVSVPFPDLSSSPPSTNENRLAFMPRGRGHRPSKSSSSPKKQRRHQVHMIPLLSSSAPATKSAPISLPKSHIRRTPSELQLDADKLHAEYKDVVMYSRLITGMHAQMLSRSDPKTIHPLTSKSMAGVLKTKQAQFDSSDELKHGLSHKASLPQQEDKMNSEWDVSYSPIDEEGAGSSPSSSFMDTSSSPSQSAGLWNEKPSSQDQLAQPTTTHGRHSRQASREYSLSSLIDDIENGGCDLEDDDCVFSLEL